MKNSIFKQTLKANWFGVCVFALLQIAGVAALLLVATYVSKMIAAVTGADISSAKNILLTVAIVSLLSCVLRTLGNIASRFVTNKMQQTAMNKVYAHMQKLSIQTMESVPTGAMFNLIYSDTRNMFGNFFGMVEILYDALYVLAIICYIFVFSPLIGGILLAGTVLAVTIGAIRMKKINSYVRVRRRVTGKYKSIVNECITSEKDVKSLNLNDNLNSSFDVFYGLRKNLKMKVENTRNLTFRMTYIFMSIIVFAVQISLAFLLRDYGLPAAMAIFIYNYVYDVKSRLVGLIDMFNIYPEFKTSCEKVDEFFDESIYKVEKYGNKNLDRVKGKIEFKNVNFNYEYKYFERTDNFENMNIKEMIAQTKEKPQSVAISEQVLKDVNFVIEPNTKVAFVGFSGSGKTTILNLITKLIDPTSGQVLIDDHDISTLSEQTLRNNIAMVSQSTYIFSGTIKDNLLLVKPDATDDEIFDALDKAFLTDFIAEQPNGIMTMVGENGLKLSGGQKQRLAIARAFLKNSKIVVFDESTSALDNVAQTYVQKSIDECKGKTIVIVAHRLSTIINVDKIYFLQNGAIVKSGTFDYLLNNDEAFKELFLTELV